MQLTIALAFPPCSGNFPEQARLLIIRTVASSIAAASNVPTLTTAAERPSTSSNQLFSSPSPRCCACSDVPRCEQNKSHTGTSAPLLPAGRHTPAVQSTNYTEDLRANLSDTILDGGGNGVPPDIVSRERGLVANLQDCLTHMTHLRDWLRLLDREIHSLHERDECAGVGG